MQVIELMGRIGELYGKISNSRNKYYMDFLQKFTDSQLDELWAETMHSHQKNTPPTIGELNRYSKCVTPVKVVNDDIRLSLDTIFNSELGQLSLEQGWSDSYRIYCQENGLPDQSDDTILMFQRSQEKAEVAMNSIKNSHNPFDQIILNMWQERGIKNQKQKERYLR